MSSLDLLSDSVPYSPSGLPTERPSDRATAKDYQPSPDELKLLQRLYQMFAIQKRHRERFDGKWGDYYKFFRGKQWLDGKRPSYLHSEVINVVFQIIQSQVPILTDTKPKFEYYPEDPTDMPIAEILNQVTEWDWNRNNWLYTLTEVIYDSHIFGTGLSEVGYDAQADAGLGKITYESLDVFTYFPAAYARDTNNRNKPAFKAELLDIAEIKRRFPEKGKYVKQDAQDFNQLDRADIDDLTVMAPTRDNVYYEVQGGADAHKAGRAQAVLFEVWIYDDEIEEIENKIKDENGIEQTEYIKKLKYPTGRYIAFANNIVLKDIPNPIEEGFIPHERLTNYIDPRMFWGISEVEQVEGPQKIFNKLVSFALDVVMLTGNPIWIVDTSAEIDTDHLTNRPGLVVEKNPGSEVRREAGVQLQPGVLAVIDKLKEWIDQLSGSQDITRGVRPEGVSAASAISQLQNAAQTRLRLKSRNLDAYLQTLGHHYMAMMFQFYSYPQIVRITNRQDPNLQEYFKFHVETLPDGKKSVHVRPYHQGEDGKYYEGTEQVLAINKTFDVRVSTGSAMPFAKIEKENRAYALFDRKIIDAEEVLKSLDYPNHQAVLSRMQGQQLIDQNVNSENMNNPLMPT